MNADKIKYLITVAWHQSFGTKVLFKFILYKDLGRTITFVDHPYWREEKEVPCNE